ncbi:hypothetical protein QSV08_19075 [Maribacter sp. BPC-D8]|uniref:ankyrin repeat domain-containing protein n=1 Tax=Maribacter sp. BPC-D8 TaxID=3053613 RepID=UPI002B4A7BBC|nr:ankyrin repeat domain-containing protein [Maribacter sp. BPC-D8]WRI29310.1 hypothetical protein QSV08_19075 [Maribacter sp. BPC-D8]
MSITSTQQLFSDIAKRINSDYYYFVILATNNAFTSALYTVENNTINYANKTVELFKEFSDRIQQDLTGTGVTIIYQENSSSFSIKSIPKYNPELFDSDLFELLIFQEFGIKPATEERITTLESSIKKEKIKNTLVYACYMNDTANILEIAKTAKKSQLNKVLEYTGTPLAFCTENNNLEGFIAVAEKGADINKKSLGSSPLQIAFKHSPDIVTYIYEHHKEAFDKEFDKKGFYLAADCTNRETLDFLLRIGGDLNTYDASFPHLHNFTDRNNLVGITFCLDNNVDINLKDKQKRTALNKAITRNHTAAIELLKSKGGTE